MLTVDANNADLVHQMAFEGGKNETAELEITVKGDCALFYQVMTSSYIPWDLVSEPPAVEQPMRVSVVYDRTELTANETVQATATVELLRAGRAGTVLVDLGIPPGFEPLTEDLDALVKESKIDRIDRSPDYPLSNRCRQRQAVGVLLPAASAVSGSGPDYGQPGLRLFHA